MRCMAGASRELALRKSCSILDLYGDSRDRINAVHEVHGGVSRELAHIKAAPVLNLYGDSRDRMNAVHEVHGEQFCNHS